MDLSAYALPLAPVPRDVEDAIGRGTRRGALPAPTEAATFLGPGPGSETVICARTADRGKHADAGLLVQRVATTPGGARMQSIFWLGEIMPKVPVVGPLVAGLLNTSFMRRQLVPDILGLALLRHCSEEMNHLAEFLPRLYSDTRR
jgi:hypothetical protein